MDDLVEILELPVDVYAEYWGAIRFLARKIPFYTAAYVAVAMMLGTLVIRWLRSGPLTVRRAFCCCFVLSLFVLPGAVANGGMEILPLALIVTIAVIEPIWLLYNVTLFAIAALAALIAARIVRAAAGKAPATARSVDVTPP